MLKFSSITLLALALSGCSKEPKNDQVNVVSWGSQFQADLMGQYVRPMAKQAGVSLREDAWDGDYAGLTTSIERGINNWDIVHVEGMYVLTSRRHELFQAVSGRDLSLINPALQSDKGLIEALKGGSAVPLLEYGYVVAGRSSKIGGRDPSRLTWADFWDVKGIPGQRGMRDVPVGNIEAALASKGLDVNTYLYKETDVAKLHAKVDEALARISEIAPSIVWWTTGEQLQQGLETGDMPLVAAWSGRVWSAYKTICPSQNDLSKCDVRANPRTSYISTDWWIIPKNAPHKDAADRLLRALVSKPALTRAAAFAERQGYSVPLIGAEVRDPVAKYFLDMGSSANKIKAGRLSEQFWGEHYTWINERWLKMRVRTQ
jgi:putative spermidine/putrescine transport system substrate-binding protein